MGYVQYIWIMLSILVSVTCSFCFLQPEWIVRPGLSNTFGMYSFCMRGRDVMAVGGAARLCGFYGGEFGFGNIPSITWQAACLLYGGGCLFMCFGALCSMATMCVRSSMDMTLMLSTRYLQISSVFLMVSGLLVYPLGFESNYFRFYCGPDANNYNVGECVVGWTYVLAIVDCALSIFCPVLSFFSQNDDFDSDNFDYKL